MAARQLYLEIAELSLLPVGLDLELQTIERETRPLVEGQPLDRHIHRVAGERLDGEFRQEVFYLDVVWVEPSRLGRRRRQQVVAYLAAANDGVVYPELDFLFGLVRVAFEGVDDKLQVGCRVGCAPGDAGVEPEELDIGEDQLFVEDEIGEGDTRRHLVGIEQRVAFQVGEADPEEFEFVEG